MVIGPLLAVVFTKGQFWAPLFVICINHLDLNLCSKLSKFADDAKLGINAEKAESVRALQKGPCSHWRMVQSMAEGKVPRHRSRRQMHPLQCLGTLALMAAIKRRRTHLVR